MPNTDRLTDAQREAIDALTSAPPYAGASKLRIFMRLPAKHKAAYFREHFLVPCIAAVIAIALCTFVIVRIASPRERPALYAAVVDSSLPLSEATKLEQSTEHKLGADVIVDDYFDTSKDGIAKLQTMISSEQIDVVIAPPGVFKELASYGYFSNLHEALPAAEYGQLHAYTEDFRGFDDAQLADDVDDSGSGRGAAEPYGLKLERAGEWHRHADGSDALVGIVANTKQQANAQRFIDYLYH